MLSNQCNATYQAPLWTLMKSESVVEENDEEVAGLMLELESLALPSVLLSLS